MTTRTLAVIGGGLVATALMWGCTVNKATIPGLTGPSELGTSITVTADPDVLTQDGLSQSVVTITVRDANGQPIRSVTLRLEIVVNGTVTDYGQLSARTLSTNSEGRATAIYTAPPAPAVSVDTSTIVTIRATPIGDNFANAVPRQVNIRLVPPGVIVPPTRIVPAFTVSPTTLTAHQQALFDASTTEDPDNAIVLYSWSFGDGSTATGRTVTHTFTAAANYQVTLTVSDSLGRAASTTQLVTVSASKEPVARFVFSPTAPATGQEIVFNATSSTADTGRTIVAYQWEFGTGRTASGAIVSKTYDTAGTYKVTLKVTDDVGRFDTDEQSVPVTAGGAGGVTAAFTFSPTNPKVGTTVYFDGTPSTSPAGVTSYQWNFGDGTTATGKNVSRAFGAAATYVVRLTITDAQGKTATTTQSVTVST